MTKPTRRWAALAFAILVAAAAANLGLATAKMLRVATTMTQLSAARHVLVQGYLRPLMVAMAPRILPGTRDFSGITREIAQHATEPLGVD